MTDEKIGLRQFWEWWSCGKEEWMEVRIKPKDKMNTLYGLIKKTSQQFRLPKCKSGVLVNNAENLEKVSGYLLKTAKLNFGINPRKQLDKNTFICWQHFQII